MIYKTITYKDRVLVGKFNFTGESGSGISGSFEIFDENQVPILAGDGHWSSFEMVKDMIKREMGSGINKEIDEWDGHLG